MARDRSVLVWHAFSFTGVVHGSQRGAPSRSHNCISFNNMSILYAIYMRNHRIIIGHVVTCTGFAPPQGRAQAGDALRPRIGRRIANHPH